MSNTLIVRSNASQGTAVLIKDMGVSVPASGGQDDFSESSLLDKARTSANLRTLTSDDAHGAGSHTLIVNDGANDIPSANVDAYLSNLGLSGKAGLIDNLVATVRPSPDDDETQGYGVGSRWVIPSLGESYECYDASSGAAKWRFLTTNSNLEVLHRQFPNEFVPLGSRAFYTQTGARTAGEIIYVRLWLNKGVTIADMRTYIVSGGGSSLRVNVGIYDQTDPLDHTLPPNDRIFETTGKLITKITNGDNGTFKDMNISANPTVVATGYCWLAFVADAAGLVFLETPSYVGGTMPVYVEAQTGATTNLPATAGDVVALTQPNGPITYVALVDA
jgi:hypothetical protein